LVEGSFRDSPEPACGEQSRTVEGLLGYGTLFPPERIREKLCCEKGRIAVLSYI